MTEDEDRFVEEHRAFVLGIVQRVCRTLSVEDNHDDLIAAGLRGLMEARRRFDPARGVRFTTFAYYRIRGAVIDEIRLMAYLPPSVHSRIAAEQATDTITESLGEERAAGRNREDAAGQLAALTRTLNRITAANVIAALGQDPEQQGNVEDDVARRRARERVRQVVEDLPERDKAIIRGIYFEERTIDSIAKDLKLTPSWVSRIHSAILDRLGQRFGSQ